MKIAFVSQPLDGVLPPNQNSIGIWIHGVANPLSQTHDVYVYSRRGRLEPKAAENGKVSYRYLYSLPNRMMFRLNYAISKFRNVRRPFFSSNLCYIEYGTQAALDLRSQQCDIVNLFNFTQFIPVIRRFNPNIKIVLRMSCEWLTQLDPRMIEKRLAKVDLVIGCSDFITNSIREAFPKYASRCHTIHNGRDVEFFRPLDEQNEEDKNKAKKLLFVGRVSPEKGLHILLKAFQEVVKQYPELKLDIVGSVQQLEHGFLVALSSNDNVTALDKYYEGTSNTSYFLYLRNLVDSLGMASKVRFIGQLPHAELIHYYREAAIFIFPSVWDEPSGNPPIEAMAVGVPVISTNTGGTSEYVIHGETGLLVEPGNTSALVKAILQLLEHDEMRESMSRAGRKRAVEHFSYQQLVESLLDSYSKL